MEIVFSLHSLWRWVVLALAVVVIVKGLAGWLGRQPWGDLDKRLGMFYTNAFNIQFVLGLILYIGVFAGGHSVRWYGASLTRLSFEHVLLMFIALGIAHIVPARVRKADGDLAKHRLAAVGYAISLIIVAVAVPTWGSSV